MRVFALATYMVLNARPIGAVSSTPITFAPPLMVHDGRGVLPSPHLLSASHIMRRLFLTGLTDSNIVEAVNLWVSIEADATEIYGAISAWDVSSVTTMSQMFFLSTTFNNDLSSTWDVSIERYAYVLHVP